ncbi:MAG TPA: hypothetical protein DCO65_10615 [Spartobacteria bacterium]|nr:hypothetical protein [Spartobacteria bacterium]
MVITCVPSVKSIRPSAILTTRSVTATARLGVCTVDAVAFSDGATIDYRQPRMTKRDRAHMNHIGADLHHDWRGRRNGVQRRRYAASRDGQQFRNCDPLLFGALVPDKNEPSGGNKNAAGKYAQEDGPAIAGKNARSLQFEQ